MTFHKLALTNKLISLSIVAALMIISSNAFVSSSYSDFWNTITGKATSQSVGLNISVGNNDPAISFVSTLSAATPTEDTFVNVIVNFTAMDVDGESNILD